MLLVPLVTELEWVIRPQLEEWAEVATPPIYNIARCMDEQTSHLTAMHVEVEEIESTRSEKLLAFVLAAFLLIGGLWLYFNLDDIPLPRAPAWGPHQP